MGLHNNCTPSSCQLHTQVVHFWLKLCLTLIYFPKVKCDVAIGLGICDLTIEAFWNGISMTIIYEVTVRFQHQGHHVAIGLRICDLLRKVFGTESLQPLFTMLRPIFIIKVNL